MKPIKDVLKEMRSVQLPGLDVTMNEWADAFETAMREKDAEIERLNEVIDRAANAWMSLEPQVAWEGDVADAMAAGVAEIERLRAEIKRMQATYGLDPFNISDPYLVDAIIKKDAEIERLTMERDNARSIVEAATREGLLAQALADVKRLKNDLREIDARIDWEITPSNYDHDDVCRMNAEWCEVGDIARAALNEEAKLT